MTTDAGGQDAHAPIGTDRRPALAKRNGSIRTQRLFAWCGPAFAIALLIGLLVAGLIPPPSPTASAEQLLEFYTDGTGRIRLGLQIACFGGALFMPFTVALFLQLRRGEDEPAPWAYLQLVTGTAGMFILMLPMVILQAALFRIHDIDPGTLRVLSDLTWILFVSPAGLFVVQTVAVGAAVLGDTGEHPAFPRWTAYVALWVAIASCLGFTVPFFKSGPLAWTGILTYWIALTAFTTFVVVMSIALLRALRDAEADRPAG